MRKLFGVREGKRPSFKQILLLVLNLALALGTAAALAGFQAVGGTLEALTAAERFRGQGEMRFAQLGCYFPVGAGKSEEDILTFRERLDTKMVEQSLEAPEGGSLYIDAYYGSATVNIRSENGSASVEALGVGGDFFFFHPLHLRSGSYISGDDLMDDLVVLDEEMAWRLFGGVELTGIEVQINDQTFLVAGVISREGDFASRKAYSGGGGIFVAYSALSRMAEGTAISGYELVMPDPISGYAKNVAEEGFSGSDVVENSARFGLAHLVQDVIGGFGERSMRTNAVIYPYWENAARLCEDYAAALLVLAAACALCPALFALVYAIRGIRGGYRLMKRKIPEKLEAEVEKRREARLEAKYQKKGE